MAVLKTAMPKLFTFALLINDAKKITVRADLSNKNEPYTVKGSSTSQSLIDFDKVTTKKAETLYLLSKEVDSLSKSKAADSVINFPYSKFESAHADLKNYII